MSAPPPLPSVAVFGLGIIGAQAADRISAVGYPLRTWSRSPRDRPDFEPDPADAAEGADVVAIYLKDAPAVRNLFKEIVAVLKPGASVVNHATIDLATTELLGRECERLGLGFLNAPFTGSKVAAGNGALVYYAGGQPGALERLRPFLAVTSTQIIEVDSPAAATMLKLTTNLISASTVQALAEGLALNLAHGVPAATYLEAIKPNACASALAAMKVPNMAAGRFEPHFSLSNMLKDARYMLDLAERAKLDTPGIATTAAQMQRLADEGHGDLDFSVLFRQFDSQPS
jgi:3-hydroxyisobutyrate dehydrogenase-like beta-hydroxyacid dehydrogenase